MTILNLSFTDFKRKNKNHKHKHKHINKNSNHTKLSHPVNEIKEEPLKPFDKKLFNYCPKTELSIESAGLFESQDNGAIKLN